jgi:hypothetical protein
MTDETVRPQDYFQGFPEAPASDTFKWIDALGYEHMTTIRAWSGTILYNELSKFVAYLEETGARTAALQPAPKPAQAPAPKPAIANASGTSFKISKIKVTPEIKDGAQRIMVELFQDGRQWADIKAFYTTSEAAQTAFSSVTDLDFKTASEYQINCIADYRLSDKKNTKGKPYNNLVAVRPA